MTFLPDTVASLLRKGISPFSLEDAANRCFAACGMKDGQPVRSALYSSDATTENFWKVFVAAHKALYRGGEEMKEAA